MTPRNRFQLRRRLGAAVSLVYLLVAVLVPLAHARAETGSQASLRAETHLHAPGTDCPPPHDEHHCPACHFAGLQTLPSGATCVPLAEADAGFAPARRGDPTLSRHPVRTPGSRAPPTA